MIMVSIMAHDITTVVYVQTIAARRYDPTRSYGASCRICRMIIRVVNNVLIVQSLLVYLYSMFNCPRQQR